MFWNSKHVTYYDRGRKAYTLGDEIPEKVIEQMGGETLEEYKKKGLIADKAEMAAEYDVAEDSEVEEPEQEKGLGGVVDPRRNALFEKALSLGLKPHYRTGIPKLTAMLEDHEALQALKKEALSLGINPSDDVTFAELAELVGEKNEEAELVDETDE